MAKLFSKIDTGRIQEAIDRAVAVQVKRYPMLRQDAQDISQDAWCKVLAGYDRGRDIAASLVRAAVRRDQDGPHTNCECDRKTHIWLYGTTN
jgi:hypothetical protein